MASQASQFYAPFTTATLPSGVTYRYLYKKPESADKPHLLFLHGYPSGAYDWRHQIKHFSSLGYGLIVPDLLGYGGTDKPSDPADYRMKKMASELAELLDHVGVKTVVGIGHDWGSGMLSGVANYNRDRLQALAFLAVGYNPPSAEFDLHATAAAVEKLIGYVNFGYWEFHNEDDAGKVIDDHADSYFSMLYAEDPSLWRQHVAPFGVLKEWTTSDQQTKVASYITADDKATHDEIFHPKNGGYGPALNWYKVMVRKLNNPDSAECLKTFTKIKQPVLLVTAKKDVVCLAPFQVKATEAYSENVRIEQLDTGHWVQLEEPEETNKLLQSFFEGLPAQA